MKKKLLFFTCIVSNCLLTSCNIDSNNTDSLLDSTYSSTNISQENEYTENSFSSPQENEYIEELTVQTIFFNWGTINEGIYSFHRYNTVGNSSFLYSFSYSPTSNLYNCAVLVTTNAYYPMYDYGSVTFSWGDIKNAFFYGYHELSNTAIIEFSFSNIKLNSNVSLNNSYSYQVTQNSFSNLNQKNRY